MFIQGTASMLIPIDPKIERTTHTIHRKKREALHVIDEVKEEEVEIVIPQRQILGDYYRRTESRHICLGFQPANLVTFDIKNFVLTCLKENMFNVQEIKDP